MSPTTQKNEEGYYFGTAKVGIKGQIVIPQEARDMLNINPGDTIILVGDDTKGLYLAKSNIFKEFAVRSLSRVGILKNKVQQGK